MLHVDSLSCRIGKKLILDDVSLTITRGTCLGVLGANGAAKTTLLRCLLGLIPYTGSVKYEGNDIRFLSRKQKGTLFAYVPQTQTIAAGYTVEEFIAHGLYCGRSSFWGGLTKDYKIIDDALSLTETVAFKKREVKSLSGGERQRVMLAASIAQRSPIILLDEPTSYLDPKHASGLYRILRILLDRGQTIIMTSHDINRSVSFCSDILALKQGRVTFFDSAPKFLEPQVLSAVYDTSFSVVAAFDGVRYAQASMDF